MANNLIKNETAVFYTVEVNKNTVVKDVDLGYGKIRKIVVHHKEEGQGRKFNQELAHDVAEYVGGKVIKHTRTEVITEIIEEEINNG